MTMIAVVATFLAVGLPQSRAQMPITIEALKDVPVEPSPERDRLCSAANFISDFKTSLS